MATFSRIKDWVSGEVLTASDLNGEFDNIIDNMDPPGIEDASANVAAMQSSISPGGLGTESLATSLLGEIQRLRYVIARFVNSDQSINWYVAPGRSFAAGDLDVQTADIADGAVTNAKIGAKNYQISTLSSGTYTMSSSTPADVTNLTVTITTTGRPVRLFLISAAGVGQVTEATIFPGTAGTINIVNAFFYYLRGGSIISRDSAKLDITPGPTAPTLTFSTPSFYDTPSAGTHTYKVQVALDGFTTAFNTSPALNVRYFKLVAEEV